MSKGFQKDLSQGSIVKNLTLFALPFLVSNIVQTCYNVADMLIVGNFSGTISMSGVNIGGQVTLILTNFIMGLCTGGTVMIAQYLGSKRQKDMETTISTLMTMLLIGAAAITALMLVLKNPLLRAIRTPSEAFSEADRYLTVTVSGIIFIFLYNALSAIMRGMGDSKRPLYFVLISCIANVALDLLLVARFNMGAVGAAAATVASQALSVVLCIAYMKRNGFPFDFRPSSFRIHETYCLRICKIGLPAAIQNGVVSLSFLFITMLVNSMGGVDASAAVGVVSKVNGFAILPAVALSSSISTMAAQCIGAGLWNRAKKTCWIGMAMAMALSAAVFALVQAFPEPILRLFDRTNPEMIRRGAEYFSTFSFDYLLVPICFCLNGLFIASGHTTFSLVNSAMSSLLLRVPASYIFGRLLSLGIRGIGMGAPIATAGSVIAVLLFYASGRWRANTVA
ncbi:MAG: MATE family efflux transporter [Treponemataceae bacterium]|nr:MATE family efflux transporter [Treponemataceae bacterium]